MEFNEREKTRFVRLLEYEMEHTIFPLGLETEPLRKSILWMRETGYDEELIPSDLAASGYLQEIKWLEKDGCSIVDWTLGRAAMHGYLDIVKWVRVLKGHEIYPRFLALKSLLAVTNMRGHCEVYEWLKQDAGL